MPSVDALCIRLPKRRLEGILVVPSLSSLHLNWVVCIQDEDKLAAIRADALKAATLTPGLLAAENMAKVCHRSLSANMERLFVFKRAARQAPHCRGTEFAAPCCNMH